MKLLLAVTSLILIGYVDLISNKAPVYRVEIIDTYPHDTKALTHGIAYAPKHDRLLVTGKL